MDSSNGVDTQVVVVGAGPCGLMLAIELGRRGVATVVVNERTTTSIHPKANATQARTMEHYRRLGFADRVRAHGLPADYPTDIAYFTRFAGHELARLKLPSSASARTMVKTLTGSWSAAELPHRCSQMYVERVLRDEAEKLATVSIYWGWRVTNFARLETGVAVDAEHVESGRSMTVRGSYLVGADGAGSFVRKELGLRYEGESGVRRDFFGGLMHAIHLRAPGLYGLINGETAWMYWAVNRERRGLLAALDGGAEFVFHTQLHEAEQKQEITDRRARSLFLQALGADLDFEILFRDSWVAGYTLVVERYQDGRVFLAGDAAHLFTPTGGLGYNTGVEDVVNLGWKLAATVNGWGGPGLLRSYEIERKPVGVRNTGYARRFADSIGNYRPPAELEDDSGAGKAARAAAGEYLNAHVRAEFNIPGITFGARCDWSPLIVSDGTPPPPDRPNMYEPSACPGGRAPHLWLEDGRSLYDAFGFEFTILRLGEAAPSVGALEGECRELGVPLMVVGAPGPEARDLYGADLALVRPDQVVAWRGDRLPGNVGGMIRTVTGYDGPGGG